MLLSRLGVPKLWGEDPERVWPFLRRFVSPVVLWLAPSCAYGVERVPATGGGVIAANHLSAVDPALVGATCPRPVFFMAKAELLAIPVIGEVLAWPGTFPVRRGEGDRESVRHARKLAREGRLVGVFVEGTRQRFGYPGRLHPGALMIAQQEGVPLVPCGIYSFGWSPKNRRPCAVVWGEAMDLSGYPRTSRGYKGAADAVGAEIMRLWRLAGEAVASGFPPELADGARRSGAATAAGGRQAPPAAGADDESTTASSSRSVKKARA